MLRGVFDSLHTPVTLYGYLNTPAVDSKLKGLRTRKVLYTKQWDTLHRVSVTSAYFDITLLFLLLRNICSLKPPATGWDGPPSSLDLSMEADLVRIKRCRNELYAHRIAMSVADTDFENTWTEIEAALLRLGGPRYEPVIQRLKVESMDPENEEYLNILLQSWEESKIQEDRKLDQIIQNLEELKGMKTFVNTGFIF